MKTIRKLIYRELIVTIAFVTLAFVALFTFFDLVDEMRYVRAGSSYTLTHALVYVACLLPGRLYELLPITVLIGSVTVMARLAQSSEFTILRTSGLGPWRALSLMLGAGAVCALLTFVVGDYLAPTMDRQAERIRSGIPGRPSTGLTGGWLRERQGDRNAIVNVARLRASDGILEGVRVFAFGADGFLSEVILAEGARVEKDDRWTLLNAVRAVIPGRSSLSGAPPRLTVTPLAELPWSNGISREMASVALLQPDRMHTLNLFQYIRHLSANGQTSQRYEIEFWRKVFYPLSCIVMVVLALPFAYLHFRSGGISAYVFMGVMIGISFFLLNNVFGYIGDLRQWQPWLAAAAPGLLYSLLSLSAFGWLVLRH